MGVVVTLALFALTVLGGRLIQIQGLDSSATAKEALDSRTVDMVLAARRGDITDSSGAVLASTVDRRRIVADPSLIDGPTAVDRVASAVAPLVGLPVDTVAKRLSAKGRYSIVANDIEPTVARQIRGLKLPGIFTEPTNERVYPSKDLAANVLGFVAGDGQVYGGLEASFNAQLAGQSGGVIYERGSDGVVIPTGNYQEKPAVDGGSVKLNLDRDLQFKAQQLLAAQVKASAAESASLVALDPKTGAILALAVAPTFDANAPGKSPEADRGNRALTDFFEPGSTSKVITLAAALQEGTATPSTQVTVPNRLKRSDRTFRDSHDHETEYLTTAGVLAKSSNIGTILLGEKLAPATMEKYMRAFGLGEETGVGLKETPGLLAPSSKWDGSQRYTVMFGQGVAVNTLQDAQVFATIANGGVRVPPTLVAGYTDQDGVYHASPARTPVRVVSTQTAQQMREMMEAVTMEGGTAVKASVPGYRVAGKTGTAQRAVDGRYSGYTASFIGMAPAEDPSLVIAVVVQNPTKGYYGGDVAAPVFSELMTYALAQRNVPPSKSDAPALPLTWQ